MLRINPGVRGLTLTPEYRVFPTLNEGHIRIRGVFDILLSVLVAGVLLVAGLRLGFFFYASPPEREQPNSATSVQPQHRYRDMNAKFTTHDQYHS